MLFIMRACFINNYDLGQDFRSHSFRNLIMLNKCHLFLWGNYLIDNWFACNYSVLSFLQCFGAV